MRLTNSMRDAFDRTLPVDNNLVPDLMAAGWPKGQEAVA